MIEPIDELDLYKIPLDEVIKHRKEFYHLWRRSDDQTKIWLNRVENHVKNCEFPKLIEYLLIDRFVCELDDVEKQHLRMVNNNWSIKRLNEYFDNQNVDTGFMGANSTIDNTIDPNQGELLPTDTVKSEPPV